MNQRKPIEAARGRWILINLFTLLVIFENIVRIDDLKFIKILID